MGRTIYDEGIWERILEKHPDLKEAAIKVGTENNVERAKEIRRAFGNNFGIGKLSKEEQDFAIRLSSVEFIEQGLLRGIVARGRFAHSVGADEDTAVSFKMVLEDFEWTFRDFLKTCKSRNKKLEELSFQEMYEIFLDEMVLKMEYKVPYTKLFVKRILEMSECKEDVLEIKTYFLQNDSEMFPKISEELLIE